ncbi:glycosyltransferase [Nitrososphaera sp.]|uniref:glycosyltransferase family 4 protein n=1 Tax=Nitrososphaera sp. TaxID=1971748 RepID=UPI00316FE466
MPKDRMNIGVIIDEIASGSAPKIIGQEVRALQRLGHDTESLVLKGGYSPVYNFHMEGVRVRNLMDEMPSIVRSTDMKIPGFSFFSMHHLTSPLFAPGVIKDREYDVLVTHSTYTCFTTKKLKQKRHIPYIPFIWDPMSYILPHVYSTTSLGKFMPLLEPIARWADRFILTECEAVITSGRLHHPLLRTLTDKDLEILYPGCFPVSDVNEKRENFIITFDRWDIGNTPHIFLDMMPKLEKDIKLVVAGHWHPESIKDSFTAQIKEKGLEGRVELIGPLDEKMIIDMCSRALVHVHTNKEVFGMQSLEAAACGCPIIIPEGSGVTELFENSKHGFFLKEGDIDEHAKYINELYANPEYARKIGRAAWEAARKQTWQKHGEDLLAIINRHVG